LKSVLKEEVLGVVGDDGQRLSRSPFGLICTADNPQCIKPQGKYFVVGTSSVVTNEEKRF